MSDKARVWIVILAIVLIGLPLLGRVLRQEKDVEQAKAIASVPNDPPLLNAVNLVDSKWALKIEGFSVKVTLKAGGVAEAEHKIRFGGVPNPLTGTWSVDGATLTVNAVVRDKPVSQSAHISGNDIYLEGKKAQRLQ